MDHSFCESVHATGTSPWHIRELTAAGRKLGGGADTPALCGRDLCKGWDLNVEMTDHHLSHACKKCVEVFHTLVTK